MNTIDVKTKLANLSPERRRAFDLLLRRVRERESVASALYGFAWRPAPLAEAPKSTGDAWLLLADNLGHAESLARRLTEKGARCRLVFTRDAGRSGPDAVNPGSAHDVEAVVSGWLREPAERRNVAFLWSLDTGAGQATSAASLMRDQERACGGALNVVRALAKGDAPEARLWLFTCGAQRLPGDAFPMAAAQAPLIGMGRCIGLEHPELWGGLIDLDPEAGAEVPEAVANQLLGPDSELESAWRRGNRHAPRLAPAKVPVRDLPPTRLPADATFLITGGTSELALHLARWMIDQGARSIALMSRSAGDEGIARQRDALIAKGANVRVLRGDVSSPTDVERAIADIAAGMPPLRGVVHAAAVVDYGMLRQQTWDRFATVMAPKIAGAWNLHVATRHLPLDFFVLFSSLSALGYEASSNYAAANAFLDALAHARRGEGLPASSINWTAWAQIGGIKRLSRSDQERLTASGVGFIEPDDGMHVMSIAISGGARVPAQLVVHPIADAERLRWHLQSKGDVALFRELLAPAAEAAGEAEQSVAQRLRSLPRAEAESLLEEQLKKSTYAILGLEPSTAIDPRRALVDIGMTSLLANDFRLKLALDMGLPRGTFPATMAFNYPTIEALKKHILDEVVPKLAPDTVVSKARPGVVPPKPAVAVAPAVSLADAPPVTSSAPVRADGIAIVGMSCRLPGGADSPEQFWRVLVDAVDQVRKVPEDRWDADAIYDPDPDAPGRALTRLGSFVSDWDMFDPAFFAMSPREAAATDPQQRLLLELAWTALADAGYAPEDVSGSKVGVFAAVYGTDYIAHLVRSGTEAIDVYTAAGIAHGVAAGRLSYALGVHGPSITLDAACSSSLVALHLASESLRRGECDMAIVGAASAMLGPNGHILLTKTRMISADGRSKAFDASADGYGRSEGGCVIVLKRATDATAAGDSIHAIVRASAVNQDGRSASLVAPNGPAQVAVIRAALREARLTDEAIDYVECAGTGSSIGDAIEFGALAEVFGKALMRERPLVIGSVKTNVGHTESVSGLAGLMKMVLAFRHETLPPHLHLNELNPECRPQTGELIIGSERRPWPRGRRPRLAGVQSYGMSGTNAHVILEEPPAVESTAGDVGTAVLRLSARSEKALEALARRYATYLREYPAQSVRAICAASAAGRAVAPHRLAVVSRDRRSLIAALEEVRTAGGAILVRGESTQAGPTKRAYLFAASTRLEPLRELLATSVPFRAVVERCDAAVRGRLDSSLFAAFESGAADAAAVLTASYAVQCALWDAWRAAAGEPAALVGHGLGEVAAAYAAGVMTLEDGAKLVASIAQRAVAHAGQAKWLVVEDDPERVKALISMTQGVSVVAANGPRHTLIAGRPPSIDDARERLTAAGIAVSETVASSLLHTRLLEVTEQDVEGFCATIQLAEPRLPVVSSVTGRVVPANESTSPRYWARVARSPVQFREAMRSLGKLGVQVVVEMGSGETLLPYARDTLGDGIVHLGAVDASAPADIRLETALARAFVGGVRLANEATERRGRAVDAPGYAFERQRCWITGAFASAPSSRGDHPLLGERVTVGDDLVYRSRHGGGRLAFLRDHGNYGTPIFPGMAFIEMAFAAGSDAFPMESLQLADVTFERALVLGNVVRDVELVLSTLDERRAGYVVRSRLGDEPWIEHTRGIIHHGGDEAAESSEPLASLRARLTHAVSADALYERMQAQGQDYGQAFRGMTAVWRAPERVGEALGRIVLPPHVRGEIGAYRAHPALLDACGHPTYIAVNGDATTAGSFMFAGADLVRVRRGAGTAVWSHVVARAVSNAATRAVFSADIRVYDDDGRLVAELLGVRNVAVESGTMTKLSAAPKAAAAALARPAPVTSVGDSRSLRDVVVREVGAALGMAPEQKVAPKQVLKDVGLDSLVAVQLRNRLQAATGISLPVTLLFEYPTIQAIVDYLSAKQGAGAVSAPVDPAPLKRPVATERPTATALTGRVAASAQSPRTSARLSAVLSAIEELDDSELDVLASEILGDAQ